MILLNLNKSAPDLLCPHCERPMSEHLGDGCRRNKVSRRFFLGGLGMAAAGTAAGLAFTRQAQAALEDATVAPVLTESLVDGVKTVQESAIVQAAPRIHRWGAIILTHSGTPFPQGAPPGQEQLNRTQLQDIADKEGRMVIFKSNGNVQVAVPSGTKFEEKWERPSIGIGTDWLPPALRAKG